MLSARCRCCSCTAGVVEKQTAACESPLPAQPVHGSARVGEPVDPINLAREISELLKVQAAAVPPASTFRVPLGTGFVDLPMMPI